MSDTRPEPLVPADVDLRDFAFMPLDVTRLFNSRFHAVSNDAEWRAGVTLWCKSWQQLPCGSLPDDDIELCRLAELGRDLKAWRKVRNKALHGWVKCSDGRLYHPVVTEKAAEAWSKKRKASEKGKLGNEKRWGKARHGDESAMGEAGQNGSQADAGAHPQGVAEGVAQGLAEGVDDASHRDRNRQGQGQRREREGIEDIVGPALAGPTAPPSPPAEPPPAPPLKAKDLEAEGVDRQAAADWLALRKAKRLPLTATAWADTKAEGQKVGLTPPQTVATAVANNWAGFKASWLQREGAARPAAAAQPSIDELTAGVRQRLGLNPPQETVDG